VIVRRARAEDFRSWLAGFEAVAAEGRWVATELPLDPSRRRETFDRALEGAEAASFVAEEGGSLVGSIGLELQGGRAGLGMWVASQSRGRGAGTLLLGTGVDWAREHGAHKVVLEVWPHNEPALALYRKAGFEVEGRLRRHYRRGNGELWDAICMGLVLDVHRPGSTYPDAAGLAERE
jgi:RimJ/RimL family protein N-acetyltransferase